MHEECEVDETAPWRQWWTHGEWRTAGPSPERGSRSTIRYIGPPEQRPASDEVTLNYVIDHPELFESVVTPGTPDPEWEPGDWRNVFWWHDPERDVLLVRFPLNDGEQDFRSGIWCETGFALAPDGHLVELPELRIRDLTGGTPRRRNILNRLGLQAINDQLPRHVRVVARTLRLGERWERATVEVTRPGRRGMSDLELAQWAERYVEALRANPRRPYVVLAERYSHLRGDTEGEGWSQSGLRAIVRRARQKGLLTEVGRGQTGGDLTPEAEQLLRSGLGEAWAEVMKNENTNKEEQ